jgi:two-component system chemotaxis response regulator CheY
MTGTIVESITVLIAENSNFFRQMLVQTISDWGYNVVVAKDGNEAWEILQRENAPRLVVMGWIMPGLSGPEICRRVSSRERIPYIYLILLTSKKDKEDIVAGLEAGADDYIAKPFHEEELRWRIKIGERIIRLENKISQLAFTDALTGVLNRRAFMEKLETEINRAHRKDRSLSIVMIDIDFFKKVNDTYGHQMGDVVLQRFSEHLSSRLRGYDFIGRYGGEEFIVCLPESSENQACQLAERLRKSLADLVIEVPGSDEPLRITASFGVASADLKLEVCKELLLNKADQALYRAKEQGRNLVCF